MHFALLSVLDHAADAHEGEAVANERGLVKQDGQVGGVNADLLQRPLCAELFQKPIEVLIARKLRDDLPDAAPALCETFGCDGG